MPRGFWIDRDDANRATSLLLCHNQLSLARELEARIDAPDQPHKDKVIIPERLAQAVMDLGFICRDHHSSNNSQDGRSVAGRSGGGGNPPPTTAA
jgi:hypothetical protein